jgi:two-component system chemotaxis response regulator CheB
MGEIKNILVVDDSATYRSLIQKVIAGEDDIRVVGSVGSGQEALDFIRNTPPDVITLDVEMPGMSGLQTLEKLQEYTSQNPGLPEIGVIMVSALTRRGADITIRALESGAFDFIAKPETTDMKENMEILRRQLLVKIRHFAISRSRKIHRREVKDEGRVIQPGPVIAPPQIKVEKKTGYSTIRAVLIGISTGGPKALTRILPVLSEKIFLPVFIVQHMPATFTQSLADTLNNRCRHHVIELKAEEVVDRGNIYLAPGGKHMLLMKNREGENMVLTNEGPPENGFRPSVDVLFRSAASVYRGDVLAIIMTGMGSDGTRGMGALKRLGAYTLVQDETTSVVWGMPQSAVDAGYVDEIQPLEFIPDAVERVVNKR